MKLLVATLFLSMSVLAAADERILDYHSDINVHANGSLEVTETIRVRAEGDSIRRGIYRDYPTLYRDRFGNEVEVDYEPQSVLRNGRIEAFHDERRQNGVRTYFGSADTYLQPGEYTYEYRYRAGRMLGFFDQRDELYWNVTGNGWQFPIDHASVTVGFGFPVAESDIGIEAYTGRFGASDQDYRASIDASTGGAQAQFETTTPLAPGEGLTIVVNWPAGLVAQPGRVQRVAWLLSDNANLLVALAGLFAMLAYYLPVWHHFGRDPHPGVTVARYEPPAGLSPASLRYIRRMGYDNKVMTAAVVNLAVKGYLRIAQVGKRQELHRTSKDESTPLAKGDQQPPLAKGEQELLSALFESGDTLILNDKYHERVSGARQAHRRSLQRDYRNRYFRVNGLMNLPAFVLMISASVVALTIAGGPTAAVGITIAAMVVTAAIFTCLMKQPTGIGRRILDETDGFREYLDIAEKDEMNLRNPPQRTPELFEKYLPFALALGVEQTWSERFAKVLGGLRGTDGGPYHPSWYEGAWNAGSLSSHTTRLTSSLDSAISSSMSPPGSSSGSGGGGSSGGGGGGGGGGGW